MPRPKGSKNKPKKVNSINILNPESVSNPGELEKLLEAQKKGELTDKQIILVKPKPFNRTKRMQNGETKSKSASLLCYPTLYKQMKQINYILDVSFNDCINEFMKRYVRKNQEALEEFIRLYGDIDI